MTAKELGDNLAQLPGIGKNTDNPKPFGVEEKELTPQEYFSNLMAILNDGQHDGHTALDIKNISELRDYFQGNHDVSEWVANATEKEIIEAGADKLPNYAIIIKKAEPFMTWKQPTRTSTLSMRMFLMTEPGRSPIVSTKPRVSSRLSHQHRECSWRKLSL